MENLICFTNIFTGLKTPKNRVRKSNEAGENLNGTKYNLFVDGIPIHRCVSQQKPPHPKLSTHTCSVTVVCVWYKGRVG